MSTDKTLADAQPGGRVRLGDALPPLPAPNYPVSKTGLQNNAYTASQMTDYARAALSAQPSPGGQDALAAELLAHAEGLERMAADDRETGLSIEQAIEDGEGYTPDEATDIAAGLQHDAERGEETAVLLRKAASALAARQPVGISAEWVLGYLTTDAPEESREAIRNAFAEYAALSGVRQPVGEPVAYLDLGAGGYMDVGTDLSYDELAALPKGRHMLAIIGTYGVDGYNPAQAVDLGQFRDLAEFAFRNAKLHNCWERREALARELLALIDSQGAR